VDVALVEVVGELPELFDAAGVGLLDDPHAATDNAVREVSTTIAYRMTPR
jgi:hypothetical protein